MYEMESFLNFWRFLLGLFAFNIVPPTLYLISLRFASIRLYFFGHFSGKYSKGFICLKIGDIVDNILGVFIAILFFGFIDKGYYQPMISALISFKTFFMAVTSMAWSIVFFDGVYKLLKVGADKNSRLKEAYNSQKKEFDEENQIWVDSENDEEENGKCHGKIDCLNKPVWYVLPCYHLMYCKSCVTTAR